jgi:allophanate hydrolase
MMLEFESIDLTLPGLRGHYRRGDFTPRHLIALLRDRSASYRDRNIWIHELTAAEIEPYLQLLEQSDSAQLPLYGVPFAIKDNIDLADVPTTAACPATTYLPRQSATVVAALIEAGAIPLGKTNLDQLATGLNGTRSPEPWGPCKNSFDPTYISGGSSSGSAVAVALGLASFSLGTDTAGSGRVPAAFNNIVGWKPTRGLLSTRGMVPACKSIDCMSVFALTAADINTLTSVATRFDEHDPYSRHNPAHNAGAGFGTLPSKSFAFGVPRADQLQFFGDAAAAQAFTNSVAALEQAGGTLREIDFSDFLAAARLLYEGPWIAERYHGIQPLIESEPAALLPVIATIIGAGRSKTAVDTFAANYEMRRLRRSVEHILADLDFIVTPTAGTLFTQQQLLEEPIRHNSELGYYTNFMNLLDLAAVAVPAAILDSGLPFGITLFADRFTDARLLSYAQHLQTLFALPLGATGKKPTTNNDTAALGIRQELATTKVAVCGAHMSGLPFNTQLLARRARRISATTTAPHYRFYALPGGAVPRPGLVRDEHNGARIALEVWEMPVEEFGSLVAAIPKPLGIGQVELDSGEWVPGFLCESYAVADAHDITALGDWRVYLAEVAARK